MSASQIKIKNGTATRRPSHLFHVIKISACSLRGRGTNNLGSSASRDSFIPTSSANKIFCCFNSATTSGDGGKTFSAIIGVLSLNEKFNAKIKTQTAASAAHAFGFGQKSSRRLDATVAPNVNSRTFRRFTSAATRISARHSLGIFRSDCREIFCSSSFI